MTFADKEGTKWAMVYVGRIHVCVCVHRKRPLTLPKDHAVAVRKVKKRKLLFRRQAAAVQCIKYIFNNLIGANIQLYSNVFDKCVIYDNCSSIFSHFLNETIIGW